MYTREEILEALDREERENVAYWNAFDTETFFRKIGSHWSPAETVRHLSKSTRPVAKALAGWKIVLRVMFGKAKRPSLSYDELVARYQNALAEGGQAGRFAPSEQTESDPDAWRASIMSSFVRANRDLRAAIARWPERKLDQLQLPHPLIGKLTVREMLFFTLYHQRHHMAGVDRRLKES